MKKAQRLPYLILSSVSTPIGYPCLCVWCKWGEWEGASSCNEEDAPACFAPTPSMPLRTGGRRVPGCAKAIAGASGQT